VEVLELLARILASHLQYHFLTTWMFFQEIRQIIAAKSENRRNESNAYTLP
jgi:hypothetical protein